MALLGDRLVGTGFFDGRYLQRLVEQHESGLRDQSAALWTLLMFDAFLRNVVEQNADAGRLEKAA